MSGPWESRTYLVLQGHRVYQVGPGLLTVPTFTMPLPDEHEAHDTMDLNGRCFKAKAGSWVVSEWRKRGQLVFLLARRSTELLLRGCGVFCFLFIFLYDV
jgi:hypothetical protein